jgi:hypothetical protein
LNAGAAAAVRTGNGEHAGVLAGESDVLHGLHYQQCPAHRSESLETHA